MSIMKTKPILMCKRCGAAYTFSLMTNEEDVDGEKLHKFMDGVLKDGLCADCHQKAAWYAQQGRIKDWEAGRP